MGAGGPPGGYPFGSAIPDEYVGRQVAHRQAIPREASLREFIGAVTSMGHQITSADRQKLIKALQAIDTDEASGKELSKLAEAVVAEGGPHVEVCKNAR